MYNEYDYFLLVAEEMNISRAAKRAFVSQQCLSKYIKRLETQLEIELFNRTPSLSLTAAGEIFLGRVRQIKSFASTLEAELNEIKNSDTGTLIFGSSMGRAIDLLPNVLPQFHQRYPKVNFTSRFEMTSVMERQVTQGELDLFLGLSPTPSQGIEIIPLVYETFFLAISEETLLQYFPEEYPECKIEFCSGVDIENFKHVPFMINPQSSRSNILVKSFLDDKKIDLNFAFTINSNELQLALVNQGCGACFFPQFLIPYVNRLNKNSKPMQQIHTFPVKGMNQGNHISLVHAKSNIMPNYLKYFILLIRQYFSTGYDGSESVFTM